jgi:protein phosphatase
MDYLLENNTISYTAAVTALSIFLIIIFCCLRKKPIKRNITSETDFKEENRINIRDIKKAITENETNAAGLKLDHDVYYTAKGLTDCGLIRKNNEDSYLILGDSVSADNYCSPLLCAVADGMGGMDYGELASSKAVEILRNEFNQLKVKPSLGWAAWLQKTIIKAQDAVSKESTELKTKKIIGTTLVASVLTGRKAIVANVGDSRAYLLSNGDLRQITRDHSLVGLLVEKELITPDEIYTHPRRSEIMRFIGQSSKLEVDIFEIDLTAGDILMLCSDGLWEMLRQPLLKDILINTSNLSDACSELISSANQAGGADNITVVNVKVG